MLVATEAVIGRTVRNAYDYRFAIYQELVLRSGGYVMPSKSKIETILEIGAEGGSLTLFGRKVPNGSWQFCMERNESILKDLLSEEDLEGMTDDEFYKKTGWVASFSQALDLLSRYPWHKLYPLKMHPEFRDVVLAEVEKRGGRQCSEDWIQILQMKNNE
jgi:hypothetical protein